MMGTLALAEAQQHFNLSYNATSFVMKFAKFANSDIELPIKWSTAMKTVTPMQYDKLVGCAVCGRYGI